MRMNEDRIETGRKLLEYYVALIYGSDATIEDEGEDTSAIDVIADVLHYAASCGHDIQRIVDWGVSHVKEELEDAEGVNHD